jgi:hypothetical protein
MYFDNKIDGISILRMILVKILSVNEDKLLAHRDP